MANIQNIRQDLTQALVAIVSRGIRNNQLDDAENIIHAVKILCPKWAAIDEFQPYIAIKRGNPRDALQMYMAAPMDNSKWFAMTALCLKLTGDPTWHGHATQSLEKNDDSSQCAQNLARVLLGMPALEDGSQREGPAPTGAAAAATGHQDMSHVYTNYLAV